MGQGERDLLPVVRRARAGLPGWAIAAFAAFAALILFLVLDARRRLLQAAPSTAARTIDATDIPRSLPPLAIPPEVARPAPEPTVVFVPSPSLPPRALPAAPLPLPKRPAHDVAAPIPQPAMPALAARDPGAGGPVLAVDNSAARPAAAPAQGSASSPTTATGQAGTTDRARASMLANRSTTVPQGTLIAAVLETAFDSTRPGFARAIVSRNVMGFDGTRVLIPRGSRVIGEYQSETAPGQNRALIIWTRLIRDDGATIAVGSPAADTVGRGGVRARVDNHFFERFSAAILQSALDVGVNLASRSANGTVILALPNTVRSGADQLTRPTQIPPTLKVDGGTSIGIFVARDLDFTDVEADR